MRKTPSALRAALSALCFFSLFALAASAQDKDRDKDGTKEHPNGIVQDWSHRHVVYPRVGPIQSLIAVQNDPRAIQSWQQSIRRDWRRYNRWRNPHRDHFSNVHTDWSISLGGGTTAPAMFPAKFGFDPNGVIVPPPADNSFSSNNSCTADFLVFPVNAIGSSLQPNLVGFSNLYSGTAGTTGICNAPKNGRTSGADDDGVSATTSFSYNISTAGGRVATSPAISISGTKIAFVETGSGTTARFHVLAWASGDGVATNLQTATSPKTISTTVNNTLIVATAPLDGSGTVTDLALSSGTTKSDTLSSPFVDYAHDVAYVGNDSGVLFRIANVFCSLSPCTPGTSPSPSLDATWPASGLTAHTGILNVCTGKLTGPVQGGPQGVIYVGCSDGKLYAFTAGGVPLANPSIAIGDGTAFGGLVDPPLLDGVNGYVYVESASGSSSLGVTAGTSVVVQVKSDLSSAVAATLDAAGSFNLHAPIFNHDYVLGSGTPLLYEVGPDNLTGGITLYGIGFSSFPVMNGGTPGSNDQFASSIAPASEISPLTEFDDGTEDRFFESALSAFSGNMVSFNITSTFPLGPEHFVTEGAGTSAIVVDNDATSTNQADSVYLGVLGANTAVKLTDSALQ